MRQRSILILFFAMLVATFAFGAAAGPRDGDAAPRDLRKDLAVYRELPEAKRRHLLAIDQDLHDEELADREKLLKVMQRYCEWLDKLSAEKREYVESAASPDEKIRRIRVVREEQWIANLAKADRDRIEAARHFDSLFKEAPILAVHPMAHAVFELALQRGLETVPLRARVIAQIRDRDQKREAELQGTLASIGDGAAIIRLQQQLYRQEINSWIAELKNKPLSADERKQLQEQPGKFSPNQLEFLDKLSEKHKVDVPERLKPKVKLMKDGLPMPPGKQWQQFLSSRAELDEKKWNAYQARLMNLETRDAAEAELIRLFWEKNPRLLKQLKDDAAKPKKPRPGGSPPRP